MAERQARFDVLFATLAAALIGIAEVAARDAVAAGDSAKVAPEQRKPESGSVGRRGAYALLVGCTKYDNRPRLTPLVGPANDVELMRHVLEDSFNFDPKTIVVLSEASARKSGQENRPVRKAIEREFRELARKAKPGDEIVILLCGHGSQQPDDDDPQKADELDGLDEIFLPADIGQTDPSGRIPNAIIDDELGQWTAGIAAKGAHVFLIADCCHSGTMLRGDVEVSREIPAEQLSSPQALDAARERARRNPPRKIVHEESAMDRSREGVVALYAAKADETTPERPMPYGDANGKQHGILTFTLCKLLVDQAADKNATPLTYRELGQRLQAQYLAWGRLNGPTPFVDAAPRDIDREALGNIVHVGRSRIVLSGNRTDGWTINVGLLHGMTKDSVLAVYPAIPSTHRGTPVAHVAVTESRVIDSRVVPVKYGESPEPTSLPNHGICNLVKLDFGELRLPVAIDKGDSPKARDYATRLSEAQRVRLLKLEAELKQRENEPESFFRICPALAGAIWAVQYRGSDLLLLPVDAAQVPATQSLRPGTPSYHISEDQAAQEVFTRLATIARAQNLIAVAKRARQDHAAVSAGADNQRGGEQAAPSAAADPDSPRMQVELLKCQDRDDKSGQVVPLQGAEVTLQKGDWIAFRITNVGHVPIDFTLLFVDSDFGITAIFPRRFGEGNRLEETGNPLARPFQTRAYRVNDKTNGHEHLVAIAVPSTSETDHVDFTFLAQADVPTRQRSGGANSARSFNSALGRLLRQAMYRDGGKRGLDDHEVGQHDAQLLSWNVVKSK